MHSEIYEPIWSKLLMMIDTFVLYISLLVLAILTFIQGHRDARKVEFVCQLFHKFVNGFEWKLVCFWDF